MERRGYRESPIVGESRHTRAQSAHATGERRERGEAGAGAGGVHITETEGESTGAQKPPRASIRWRERLRESRTVLAYAMTWSATFE